MLHEATPPSPREVSRFPNGGTVRVTGTRRPQEVHWQPRGRARDTLILWIEAADGGIDHLGTGISIEPVPSSLCTSGSRREERRD